MTSIKLTILIDDLNESESDYILSYGFSVLIEIEDKKLLFDAGTKIEPLLNNLKKYGLKPSSIDALILSHNHYDHTDGAFGILSENYDLPVYVHKDWNIPVKYQGKKIPTKNLIINKKGRIIEELKGIYLTDSYFSSDYGGIYEQACYIKTKDAYILLCGCCHPGLNNFLKDRKKLFFPLNSKLHLIGGLHGFAFTDQQAAELNPFIKSVIMCHCTMKIDIFEKQFGKKCELGIVGKTLIF